MLYLENPSWTKEDTLSLLDAVRIFDLEWNLVASTFHGDSRKTPSACRQRYQQLEELEADKRRLSVKRPSPTKQQQPPAPARPQTVPSPSPPPQQKLPPRAPQLSRQLPPSPPIRQQPTQPQLHQQPRPAQQTNARILSPYGPPPISIGAGTTIFPLGPGSPFAFDPSAFMRGVNGHPQGMPSLFALPQPLPSIFPNPALHPSFASLPSLPPLPSLSQALGPPPAPTSTAGPAMPANRSACPNHSTPSSRQNSTNGNINNTTNPVKPSAKPNIGISKLGAKSSANTNNAHNSTNSNGNTNGSPAGKRQLVPISTNPTLPPPSATSSSATPSSSSGGPSVVVISTEEWRKKRRRRTASEISRNFKCDIPTCSKAYGSEGALKMHIRLKHPGLRLPISKPQFPRPNPLLLSSFLPLGVGSVMLGQNAAAMGFPSPLPRLVPQQAKSLPAGLSPQLPGTSPLLGSPSSASSSPQQRPTAPLSDPVLRPQPSNAGPTAVSVKREEVILSVAFMRLEIGGYECMSKTTGDLVAHFNFTHKRLLWEVVSGGAKLSIYSVFDELAGFGLEMLKDGSAVLTIEFSLPPEVSWEGNISMQHTIAKCKRHALHFPPHALNKPVEMMLTLDERLRELANLGLPTLVDPYFELDDSSSSSSSDSDEDGPHSLGTRQQHKRPSQSAGGGSPS